jgi:aldehyde:ferredoxin oxidoreductase
MKKQLPVEKQMALKKWIKTRRTCSSCPLYCLHELNVNGKVMSVFLTVHVHFSSTKLLEMFALCIVSKVCYNSTFRSLAHVLVCLVMCCQITK